MQNFWYHSPVRFYSNADDLVDTTNPQNLYNNFQPYPLELGVYHRYLLPNINNVVSDTNLKLILVSQFSEIEIPCLFKIADSKLQNVTFKHTSFASGYFEIRNSINEVLFTSNCVKFIDSSDFYGRKFIRVITKHTYDRFLFNYDDYMVTNLPAYNIGKFKIETDASNSRTGNNSSLRPKEAYHDEVTPYEFMANGDSNILGFLQTHVTNNEFYIDGTLRTSLNKLEADEFNAFGKIDFVNVKDSLGQNITINENDIFSDIYLKIIEFTPVKGYTDAHDLYSGLIKFRFNSDVYSVGDITKAVYLYRVESGATDSIFIGKGFSDFTVDGDTVIFNVESLPPGEFYMIIDNNLFKNSLGDVFNGINSKTEWTFTMTDLHITPEISISWEDGTNTDLSGILTNITLKIESEISSPSNPIIGYSWESSTDGISYTQFGIGNSNKTVSLNPGDNFYRIKVTLQDMTEVYSNILKYTRESIPITEYYYKAVHPYNHNGNDFVRFIDQNGNEVVEILTRSHWEDSEWIEAPCTLIQANQILETKGAITCTP